MSTLHLRPRYHRWNVDSGTEWLETNTGYAQLDWRIPLHQAALILVDVWDNHYLKDTEARIERIVQHRLAPLVTACRGAGLQIIHAPAPHMAVREPRWIGHTWKLDEPLGQLAPAEWPPEAFRQKTGPYTAYARPVEPREHERHELSKRRQIHPLVRPQQQDVVIATGEELHRFCDERGILFLFFTGFNTNACVLRRDYGTLAMRRRGYEILLVRDCTTGMESPETQAQLSQTHAAILFLEMFGHYTVTSNQIVAGLPQEARAQPEHATGSKNDATATTSLPHS